MSPFLPRLLFVVGFIKALENLTRAWAMLRASAAVPSPAHLPEVQEMGMGLGWQKQTPPPFLTTPHLHLISKQSHHPGT